MALAKHPLLKKRDVAGIRCPGLLETLKVL
jgi:hypothetical protein